MYLNSVFKGRYCGATVELLPHSAMDTGSILIPGDLFVDFLFSLWSHSFSPGALVFSQIKDIRVCKLIGFCLKINDINV